MPNQTESLSVREAAETRRSIRRFAADAVPEEDLREIVRLAGLAPSAWNAQPWRFIVVRDPELKAQLAVAANGQRQITSAPVVIVVYADIRDVLAHVDEIIHPTATSDRRASTQSSIARFFASKTPSEQAAWANAQSNIALGFLLLAAQSLGYATSPMLGFDAAKVKDALGLPADVAVTALVALGIADEQGREHHRHPTERIATFR